MRKLGLVFFLLLLVTTAGCAAGVRLAGPSVNEEWPSGPGTIPPSWYDYDPQLKHWFDPWYHNPYYSTD